MLLALRSACLAAALLLIAGAASAAGVPIVKKSIALKTRQLTVDVAYPQTGNKAVDAVLLAYARRQVDVFKRFAKNYPGDNPYTLDVGYDVERNDGQMLGIVFGESSYTGGAHGNNTMTTFNFLMPDGAQVFIGEIVAGRNGIDRISRLTIAKLTKEIATGPDAPSDLDSIKLGAGPLADNFKAFILLPGKLHLYFPPYQVASYAAGPQETTLDLQALKDVIRADWRAPAPSFDCRKANSTIEKTVCASAPLARLDRQMAEAYEVGLHNVDYDPDAAKKLKQQQRDWLARLLKTCTGPAPGVCLTKMYGERLAVLTTPPV